MADENIVISGNSWTRHHEFSRKSMFFHENRKFGGFAIQNTHSDVRRVGARMAAHSALQLLGLGPVWRCFRSVRELRSRSVFMVSDAAGSAALIRATGGDPTPT